MMPGRKPSRSVTRDLDDRLAHGLARIAMASRHQAFRAGGPKTLSVLQAQVLLSLQESAPCAVSALARKLGLSIATVSESVSALVKRGHVTKRRDGRVVALSLTRLGRRTAERVGGWPDFVAACLQDLAEPEKVALLRAVVAMIHQLQRQGVVQSARMCPSCVYFRPQVHVGEKAPHHCEFVDAPLSDMSLRLDCDDHREESTVVADGRWRLFMGGKQ